MHNQPLKTFTSNDVPGPYAMLVLDKQQTKLVDGDNGGSWNPTYPIIIGGSGFIVNGPSQFNDASGTLQPGNVASLQANGTVSSGGVVNCGLDSLIDIAGSARIEFQSGSTGVWANVSLAATSQFTIGIVAGSVAWVGLNATVASTYAWAFGSGSSLALGTGSTWNATGGMAWNGTVFYGTTDPSVISIPSIVRSGALTLSAATSQICLRPGGTTLDADSAYDTSSDEYTVPKVSADRTYQVRSPSITLGDYDGKLMTFTCLANSSAHAVTFVRTDGSTIGVSPSSGPWWVTFEWSNSNKSWRAYAWNAGQTNTQQQS